MKTENTLIRIIHTGIVDDGPEPFLGGMKSIGNIMSNSDHQIEEGSEDKLKSGDFCGEYSAWNFHGDVWWCKHDKVFKCKIMRYHEHTDTIRGDSLQEIMDAASDMYGSE